MSRSFMSRSFACLSLWLCLLASGSLLAGTVQPFTTGSLQQIEAAHDGRPFVLMLWSLQCAPCMAELQQLAALQKGHGELPVVLVSTDDRSQQAEVQAVLEDHGLRTLQTWQFADPVPEKLRFHIDPQWYGELPRSYFYDAGHRRTARSGLDQPELVRFLTGAAR